MTACYCKQRGIIVNMAKKPLDRYVEAGKEFTEASRRCLEGIVHDLAGERGPQREHPEDWAEEMVERGRRVAEQLGALVRREVRHQIKQFNLATNQDVIEVVQHFVERTTKAAAPVMDAAARTMTGTKKSAEKRATAQSAASAKAKPAAKKAAPANKPAPAKKAAQAKKPAPAKKAPANKAAAAKKTAAVRAAPAKKAAAKKAAAKKAGDTSA